MENYMKNILRFYFLVHWIREKRIETKLNQIYLIKTGAIAALESGAFYKKKILKIRLKWKLWERRTGK